MTSGLEERFVSTLTEMEPNRGYFLSADMLNENIIMGAYFHSQRAMGNPLCH